VNTSILIALLALVPVCCGGQKAEPAYELAAITEVSNVGRAVTSEELERYAKSGNLPTWFSTAS
jgi:hypothetical protein